MNNSSKNICILVVSLLFHQSIFAQDKTLEDTIHLQGLRISSSLNQSRAEQIGGALAIVVPDQLQSDVATQLSAFLPEIPGLFIQEGTINTNRITIRGIGSRTPYSTNRVKLYFDGIPISNALGESSISDLEVLEARNLEVLRGPSSAIYGAGLGGVISIRSQPKISDTTHLMIYSMAGSFGRQKLYIRPFTRIGRFHFSLGFGNDGSEGYRENSAYRKNSFRIISGFRFDNSRLNVFIQRAEVTGQIPSSISKSDFELKPWSAARNWKLVKGYERFDINRAGLTLEQVIHPLVYTKTALFGSISNSYESRPFNIQSLRSSSFGFRQVVGYSGSQLGVRVGSEGYYENIEWQIFETLLGTQGSLLQMNDAKLAYLNVFTHIDWELNRVLDIELGTNLQIANRLKKGVLSPRFGFGYSGLDFMFIHGSIGHGFSLPSLEESILPDGGYNKILRPEEGWNLDLGTRLPLAGDRLTFDINVYQVFLLNLIITQRLAEDKFLAINAGKTNHRGIELFSRIQILRPENEEDVGLDLELSATWGRYKFVEFKDRGNDYSGLYLPGIPNQNLFGSLKMKNWNSFSFNLDFQLVGKQYLNDANSKEYPGYKRLDFGAGYNTKLSEREIRLFGGIKNITNEQYASMILINAPSFGSSAPRYYYPAASRNYFIGLRLTL